MKTNEVTQSNCVKYLGVTLDKKLIFKDHIQSTSNKAVVSSRALYCLLNKKSKLNIKNKLILYSSCIRPIMLYACPVWKNAAKTHLNKLQIIQNKNLKIIYGLHRLYSTEQLHHEKKQKLIKDTIDIQSCNFSERCRISDYAIIRGLAA